VCLASFLPDRAIWSRWHLWSDEQIVDLAKKQFWEYRDAREPRGEITLFSKRTGTHRQREEEVIVLGGNRGLRLGLRSSR
jgi:hypothetical protein